MRAGADRDGDADGDDVVESDFGELDSKHGGLSGRGAAGGEIANVLPGQHGRDGILAGRIGRRRDWVVLGDDDVRRIGICVPAGASSGIGVRDGSDDGRDRNRSLRQFAEESDGAGYTSGDLFHFVDYDVERAGTDAAELFDAGGKVGVCAEETKLEPSRWLCIGPAGASRLASVGQPFLNCRLYSGREKTVRPLTDRSVDVAVLAVECEAGRNHAHNRVSPATQNNGIADNRW